MIYYCYSDRPLPFSSEKVRCRPAGALEQETALFPPPGREFYPALPQNLLLPFCKNAPKRPALLIQSADYCHGADAPALLCEQEAFALAQQHNARLYYEEVAASSYFCYREQEEQHLVWLEDGFHLFQKLRYLQQNGVTELAFAVQDVNWQTLSLLLSRLP